MIRGVKMKEENIQIDMIPFYAEALSYKPTAYKQIDKIYEENRHKYYQAYKKRYPKNLALATDKTLIQDIYFRKAAGIICYIQENQDKKNLDELNNKVFLLFKKCYKNVYNYVNKDDFKKFSGSEFRKWLNTKEAILSNTDLACWISAGIFFSQFCKSVDLSVDEKSDQMILTLKQRELYYSDPNCGNIALADNKRVRQLIASHSDVPTQAEAKAYLKSAVKDLGLELLFNSEFSTLETAIPLEVSEKDRFDLYISKDMNKLSDTKTFYTYGILIKKLLQQYQEVKELYKNDCEDTAWCEVGRLQHELTELRSKLESAEFRAKSVDEALKEKIKKIVDENSVLQKKVNKLESEIDQKDKNEKELYALREYAYSQRQEIEDKEIKADKEKLNAIRGVIVGGHVNWINKLKTQLPNWTYINDIQFDDNIVKNADILIINVDVMSHTLYNKVQRLFTIYNVPIGYVSAVNIDKTLVEISNIINSK